MSKTYLGDGVYVNVEHGMIKLTTENGIDVTNEILLEPEVWQALDRFVERVWNYHEGDGGDRVN